MLMVYTWGRRETEGWRQAWSLPAATVRFPVASLQRKRVLLLLEPALSSRSARRGPLHHHLDHRTLASWDPANFGGCVLDEHVLEQQLPCQTHTERGKKKVQKEFLFLLGQVEHRRPGGVIMGTGCRKRPSGVMLTAEGWQGTTAHTLENSTA